MFEVEQMTLFYTAALGYYRNNRRSKRQNYKSAVDRPIHIWLKGPSYLEAIENVDYPASGEGNTAHPGWTFRRFP